jgi:hypothetical protein
MKSQTKSNQNRQKNIFPGRLHKPVPTRV